MSSQVFRITLMVIASCAGLVLKSTVAACQSVVPVGDGAEDPSAELSAASEIKIAGGLALVSPSVR